MSKLTLDDNEVMSRKEYLKRKKKKNKILNSNNMKKYIIIGIIALLGIYAVYQFYTYYKENNYKYVTDEHIDNQKVYDIYYMSEGYTYNPKSSLNYIKSNSLNDELIYQDLGFTNISSYGDYIFGVKEGTLYKLNKLTNEITVISDNEVSKYINYNGEIYYVAKEEFELHRINYETLEGEYLGRNNVSQILIDENNIYVCVEEKTDKTLVKINKETLETKELTESENISYMIQGENNIFFVNKDDENRIYSLNKESGDISKVTEEKCIADIGHVNYVNGDKYMFVFNNELYFINTDDNRNLWKTNLDTKKSEKVIHMSIDILLSYENVVIYKVKDQKGIYLYNLETNYSGLISSRLITEVIIDKKGE